MDKKLIIDAKNAEGKPLAFEVLAGFANALSAVVQVSMYGYKKHTIPGRERLIAAGATPDEAAARIPFNNWHAGDIETYDNAMMRHILARMAGEEIAADSGLLHRAHEAWNALAALELSMRARADENRNLHVFGEEARHHGA